VSHDEEDTLVGLGKTTRMLDGTDPYQGTGPGTTTEVVSVKIRRVQFIPPGLWIFRSPGGQASDQIFYPPHVMRLEIFGGVTIQFVFCTRLYEVQE